MSMRRTWAVFTFCNGYPVLIGRYQSQGDALRAAEHLSCDGRIHHVVEQLLPERAHIIRTSEHRRLPTGIKIENDSGGVSQM